MLYSHLLPSLLLALAPIAVQAQSTVYACTATLFIRDISTTTITSFSVSTSIRTTTSVYTSFSTAIRTITQTVQPQPTQPPWTTSTSTYTPPWNPGWPTPSPTSTWTPQPTPQPTSPSNPTLPTRLNQAVSGTAQQGATNVEGGACSYAGYTLPAGLQPIQLSTLNWNRALYCGACVQVTHATNGRSTTGMIVDQGGSDANALTLSPQAYSQLGSNQAILPISWTLVRCPSNGPLRYRAKEGSSQWYLALQIRDSRTPIAKVEVSADGGRNWRELVREPYNYWVLQNGSGSDRVDVRVSDVEGRVIIDNNVWAVSEVETVGGGNFS
ncbi:hypothetical protein BJ508DRAFT_362929 [Ascobolus immersus RN42]|uniref:Expansin-like EG45 domain-containing protein n=1 Tax=Ascobolus immersus RN42 TaxID=1160509 RepID=A0A3N4I393_ASCIM|nr:hypothetical protein BJ508DRAFT_362929 [Ascobolus immersus RN42]